MTIIYLCGTFYLFINNILNYINNVIYCQQIFDKHTFLLLNLHNSIDFDIIRAGIAALFYINEFMIIVFCKK